MKVQIVGIEHRKGKAKQTGAPYDSDVLYFVNQRPMMGEALGSECDSIWIPRSSGLLPEWPPIGAIVDIGFDSRKRVEYVDILK